MTHELIIKFKQKLNIDEISIILIIDIIISYDQNISLIFYVNDGSHVRLRHPSCVYISAQRQYTAVLKMCTLTSLPILIPPTRIQSCKAAPSDLIDI